VTTAYAIKQMVIVVRAAFRDIGGVSVNTIVKSTARMVYVHRTTGYVPTDVNQGITVKFVMDYVVAVLIIYVTSIPAFLMATAVLTTGEIIVTIHVTTTVLNQCVQRIMGFAEEAVAQDIEVTTVLRVSNLT